MQQRDLVWVKVPFSDFEGEKIRPALIVSNDAYNYRTLDVVVCAVTSNLMDTPYSVLIGQNDLVQGALPIPSKVRADKIFQIEKSKVGKIFAKLNDKTFDEIVKNICELITRK